jgi:AraC family transcriptional activator FtrA
LVVVLAYDGLCTFEFGVAVELFGLPRPEMGEGWYRFATAAVEPGELRGLGGVRIAADGGLALLSRASVIVAPGWRGAAHPVPEPLVEALKLAHARGARLMSICSGVFVLAATGLLDGRRATTHWRYAETLRARHPAIEVLPDVLYVDEGDVLTSAGSAAGLDLGLHLIRRDFGPEAANSVARRLVIPPHRDGGQAQFIPPSARPAAATGLGPTLDWACDRLGERLAIADLARHAHMSVRTFNRRFAGEVGCPPKQWLTEQRVARARELLESSDDDVERIAQLAGFPSTAALREHLRRRVGLTPTAYRRVHRGGDA